MKKLFLLLSIVLLSQFSFSQSYNGERADEFVSGADEVWFKDNRKIPAYIHFRDDVSLSVQQALDMVKKLTESDRIDFVLTDTQRNRNGEVTYRYAQLLDGLRVEFMVLHVHVRNDRVFAVNGDIRTDERRRSSFRFAISESDGLERALEYHGADVYMWQDSREESLLREMTMKSSASYFPKGERVLVPVDLDDPDSELKAVYKFDIFSKVPYDRKHIYIDAVQGDVVLDVARIYRADDRVGTAHTQYNGIREINTEFNGTRFILKDNTRGKGIITLNCRNDNNYGTAVNFTDEDNIWNNENRQLDQYATDAHFATMATYDYYLQVHGRNSIDGQGHALYSYVHFNLIKNGYPDNANAFWNGQVMTYGDGDESKGTGPFMSLDICAHEITHGLTEKTANLIYQNESGALNEAFSDIFGASIEYRVSPEKSTWVFGEDIGLDLRSMSNPKQYNCANTYKGEFWITSPNIDKGGVHYNSGVLNYWYYLVSMGGSGTNDLGNSYEITGIGIEKAEQIAFRMLTVYLTNSSGYKDAAYYGLRSAQDLFGEWSVEAKAVGEAFYAVGVTGPYEDGVNADFEASPRKSCSAPVKVYFNNKSYNAESYIWNFGDGNTSTEENPAHTYTSSGSYTVTLTVNNSQYGESTKTIENCIVIDESLPCWDIVPVQGNSIIEKYSGTIYDAGGPDENYFDNSSGSLTIYAPGAERVLLNIAEFDIQPGVGSECNRDYIVFYDGNSTESPIINSTSYCNLNGNPGSISSTGEYITIEFVSDATVSHKGFKIEFFGIGDNIQPISLFKTNKMYSCDGLIQFTDESLNSPTSWNWNFGDGTTSTDQNPAHQYAVNGIYSVNLSVTNQYGNNILVKNDLVKIDMPDAPVVNKDIEACSDKNFEIDLELEGNINWFNNVSDATPVHTGAKWDHPAISENKTYFIRKVSEEENSLRTGLNEVIEEGTYDVEMVSEHDYLVFDVYSPFTLKSVLVDARGGKNRTIILRNSKKEIITEKVIDIPHGSSRIELNMEIPVGNNLELTVGGQEVGMFETKSSSLNFPYKLDNIVNIKYANDYNTSLYPFFYDWEITTSSCKSAFTEIVLIPKVCDSGIDNENITENIYINPNPGKGIFYIYGLAPATNYQIMVTDVSGKNIRSFEASAENNLVDLTSFSDGIYLVRITNQQGEKTLKLINLK